MELPSRAAGDVLLAPGELTDIRRRLRSVAAGHDLATVICHAFDRRTRMLPFFYADMRIAPAGVRALGAALVDAGFEKTRIVLQQWNPQFRPSRMRLDGRVPDLFLVSSMQIHQEACRELLRDACRLPPAARPLIVAGGPAFTYQPWSAFCRDGRGPASADVAVTGEAYVLLHLLEVLLSERATGETLRSTFERVRGMGLLEAIPGLVYPREAAPDPLESLVDTGVARLAGDLDELPHAVIGYGLLEAPGRGTGLAGRALGPSQVRRHTPIASLVMTFGCKMACPYCPIPAYNQRQYRSKSGARLAREMTDLYETYGLHYVFGTDDNFFNDRQRTLDIVETLSRTEIAGRPLRRSIRWATEVTVRDTLALRDDLRAVRDAGVRALWLGVEDMSGALVKKGQSQDSTLEAFRLLSERGISPMPMLMHHDGQALWTRQGHAGLLNQVRLLRRAGAVGMQVLTLIPAPGSRSYEETFTSGTVFDRVGARPVAPHMMDGNYVVASRHRRPWTRQANLLLALLYFYNPLRFLKALVRPRSSLYLLDCGAQALGMVGWLHNLRRTGGWLLRLWACRITRCSRAPGGSLAGRDPRGGRAGHALAGAPGPELRSADTDEDVVGVAGRTEAGSP